MLLDALIATMLVGVLGFGLTYAAARAAAAQRTGNAQNLAVGALRAQLQSAGFADGCPVSGTSQTSSTLQLAQGVELKSVKGECTVAASTVTASGISRSVKVPHVEFQLLDAKRFGSEDALVLKN